MASSIEDYYRTKGAEAPNLFMIGSMRAGSTTLHTLLGQHQEIFMSATKEPMFFVAEVAREKSARGGTGCDEARKEVGELEAGGKFRTLDRYQTLFAGAGGTPYRGESSHYLYHPP